jgi:hypothetical protein
VAAGLERRLVGVAVQRSLSQHPAATGVSGDGTQRKNCSLRHTVSLQGRTHRTQHSAASHHARQPCPSTLACHERYVLAIVEGGWSIYNSERSQSVDEAFFDTEDEACSYLLLEARR